MNQHIVSTKPIDPAVYEAALAFVQAIGTNLACGRHYQDTYGHSLSTLDQVMQAVQDNRWPHSLSTHPTKRPN